MARIARALEELMRRLGYQRYGVQGGDIGAVISPMLGVIDADHVVGIHVDGSLGSPGGIRPSCAGLTRRRWHGSPAFNASCRTAELLEIQSTRPQTLGFGLTDSPVGQLAWIVEKFNEWTDPAVDPRRRGRSRPAAHQRQRVLADHTATSAARLYKEGQASWGQQTQRSEVPSGVAVFPGDVGNPAGSIAERDHNVVHWSEFERGGHFPAMEVPDLLVGDVRAFFRGLR